jgi:phage host-nuclease inhibitor protein Gam
MIKKEIYRLEKEKGDIAMAVQVKKESQAKQIELEIMELKVHIENMMVAETFRKATLKAEIFYTWIER